MSPAVIVTLAAVSFSLLGTTNAQSQDGSGREARREACRTEARNAGVPRDQRRDLIRDCMQRGRSLVTGEEQGALGGGGREGRREACRAEARRAGGAQESRRDYIRNCMQRGRSSDSGQGLTSHDQAQAAPVSAPIRATAGSHVFFLHGRGVEEGRSGRRYGTFQFDQIVASLQAQGRNVHASRRSPGSIGGYANELAAQIKGLINAGVPARKIGVVGFSRGGHIALVASDRLRNPEISYVILAGCTNPGFQNRAAREGYMTSGRILSLVDAADDSAGPCSPALAGQHRGGTFQESVLNTGRGHALFYSADPSWLAPTQAWLRM